MKNLNKTLFIWLLLVTSLCVWFALARIHSIRSADLVGQLKLLSTVVVVDCILIGLFVKWGWRWRLLHPWLVPFPNLNGVWKGEIHSTYKDANTGQSVAGLAATLTIRQTFTDISCVMETAEMRSTSSLADFDLNPEKQQKQLVYVYCSRPKLTVSQRSPMHDGAVVFDIVNEPATRLSGRYWTARGTRGEIELKRRS
jgi:SMODS-associating 2TM, beta-strand rich effector domain